MRQEGERSRHKRSRLETAESAIEKLEALGAKGTLWLLTTEAQLLTTKSSEYWGPKKIEREIKEAEADLETTTYKRSDLMPPGKGSKARPVNRKAYAKGYDRVFKKGQGNG